MTLHTYIIQTAQVLQALQLSDGSFAAGNNGPYHITETNIRNTSHTFLLLKRAYELTQEETFLVSAKKAATYLMQASHRPDGYTFQCFTNTRKDKANGLIGQAWIYEALAAATELFQDATYITLAQKQFLQHPFIARAKLWQILDIDGVNRGFDYTFNHQLWFAAVGAQLIDETEEGQQIKKQVQCFMDALTDILVIDKNGFVHHSVERANLPDTVVQNIKRTGKQMIKTLFFPSKRFGVLNRGYHLFNVYGFSMLYEYTKEHAFWNTNTVPSILCVLDQTFISAIEENPYTYPYNPPGFEYVSCAYGPFATYFDEEAKKNIAQTLIQTQFKKTYNPESKMHDRGTDDSRTLTARTYELCRVSTNVLSMFGI